MSKKYTVKLYVTIADLNNWWEWALYFFFFFFLRVVPPPPPPNHFPKESELTVATINNQVIWTEVCFFSIGNCMFLLFVSLCLSSPFLSYFLSLSLSLCLFLFLLPVFFLSFSFLLVCQFLFILATDTLPPLFPPPPPPPKKATVNYNCIRLLECIKTFLLLLILILNRITLSCALMDCMQNSCQAQLLLHPEKRTSAGTWVSLLLLWHALFTHYVTDWLRQTDIHECHYYCFGMHYSLCISLRQTYIHECPYYYFCMHYSHCMSLKQTDRHECPYSHCMSLKVKQTDIHECPYYYFGMHYSHCIVYVTETDRHECPYYCFGMHYSRCMSLKQTA